MATKSRKNNNTNKQKADKKLNLKQNTTKQRSSKFNLGSVAFWKNYSNSKVNNVGFYPTNAKITSGNVRLFGAIGLILVILVAYALGRMQTSCASVYSSNIGTLKYMQVMVPKNNTFSIASFFPVSASNVNSSDLQSEKRLILVNPQGQTLQVVYNFNEDLSQFDGKNVILTGRVSPCTQTVSLDTLQNLTPLITGSSSAPSSQ